MPFLSFISPLILAEIITLSAESPLITNDLLPLSFQLSFSKKAFLENDNWKLNGSKSFVINGDSADKVIISARINGEINDKNGIGLFLVDNNQIKNRSYNTIDGYRAAAL